MTDTPAPDAAVQIARDGRSTVGRVMPEVAVDRLHRAGWLHDPAEIAWARDVIKLAETFRYRFTENLSGASTAMEELFAALDAAPAGAAQTGGREQVNEYGDPDPRTDQKRWDDTHCAEDGCDHPRYSHTGQGGRCVEGRQKDTAAWRCDCRAFVEPVTR